MGLAETQAWLETLPEYAPAMTAWEAEAPGWRALSEGLADAIRGAPMPEHWGLSAGTLRRYLCGDPEELKLDADGEARGEDATWPLIFRASLAREVPLGVGGVTRLHAAEGVTRLHAAEGVVLRETSTPERVWRSVVRVLASAFVPEALERLKAAGIAASAHRVAVVIQPFLVAEHSGRVLSGGVEAMAPRPEYASFWPKLIERAAKAEKVLGRPVELDWLWDGEQLWWLGARPLGQGPRPRAQSGRSDGQALMIDGPWRDRPIKTLLVDLDGTLLGAYEPLARAEFLLRALTRLSKRGGLRTAIRSLRAVTEAVERPLAEDQVYLNAERGARAFARETGLSIEEAGQVLRDEVTAIFPEIRRYFFPVDGAREFIDWARTRYRLVLATNPVWPVAQVELRLKWAGIDPAVFASITHSERMHACKPSEAYYRELLEQEGLEAADCALVGDDVTRDLPATRVGISVFILDPPPVTQMAFKSRKRHRQALLSHGGLARAAGGTYADLKRLMLASDPLPS
jgi:FMN phosphatase YigB (HAD superfamily)